MKKQTQNKLLEEVSKQVKTLAKSNAENEKLFKHAKVCEVKEFRFTNKDKKSMNALVVYLPFPYLKEHKNSIKKIINHLTEKRKQHTFVLAKRTIIHKRSDYKQQIPNSRTLCAVYDSILEDLLTPGVIIGKRTRIRMNGTHLMKIHVDENSRKFLDNRVELITLLYKQLTNRTLAIEFRPEESYISIPKVRTKRFKKKRKN